MTCDAKMRPFPDDTELTCEGQHDVTPGAKVDHYATLRNYAYPGSATTIYWAEADRRTFRGEWSPCQRPGCILPGGHHGRDAF